MGRVIKAQRAERIRRLMKRNTNPSGNKPPIYGIFSRLAACRTKPEGHTLLLQQARMFDDQSRTIRRFNVIAALEGRDDRLYDMAPLQMAHNGGPRLVN